VRPGAKAADRKLADGGQRLIGGPREPVPESVICLQFQNVAGHLALALGLR
jgi:hypothetical protein